MVYRSGDTIVREHFVHANDEEPTTTSRIHFSNEQEAQAWYSVWNSTILLTGQNVPLQVGISTLYSGTLLISNEAAIIASPVWPVGHFSHCYSPQSRGAEIIQMLAGGLDEMGHHQLQIKRYTHP